MTTASTAPQRLPLRLSLRPTAITMPTPLMTRPVATTRALTFVIRCPSCRRSPPKRTIATLTSCSALNGFRRWPLRPQSTRTRCRHPLWTHGHRHKCTTLRWAVARRRPASVSVWTTKTTPVRRAARAATRPTIKRTKCWSGCRIRWRGWKDSRATPNRLTAPSRRPTLVTRTKVSSQRCSRGKELRTYFSWFSGCTI